jgi:thiol-disulfide isomerase/thioredoxin
MKRFFFTVLIAALLPASAMAAGQTNLHPFVRGSWKQLTQAHKGEPIVVHFWGLTCGPCLAELPQWTAEQKKRPDLRLVLVDSSPFGDEPGQVWAALKRDGLTHIENWLFADSFEERLRYEIDPGWRGEMPYTLLIGRDGKITPVTGEMDFAKLNRWLDGQASKRLRPIGK